MVLRHHERDQEVAPVQDEDEQGRRGQAEGFQPFADGGDSHEALRGNQAGARFDLAPKAPTSITLQGDGYFDSTDLTGSDPIHIGGGKPSYFFNSGASDPGTAASSFPPREKNPMKP